MRQRLEPRSLFIATLIALSGCQMSPVENEEKKGTSIVGAYVPFQPSAIKIQSVHSRNYLQGGHFAKFSITSSELLEQNLFLDSSLNEITYNRTLAFEMAELITTKGLCYFTPESIDEQCLDKNFPYSIDVLLKFEDGRSKTIGPDPCFHTITLCSGKKPSQSLVEKGYTLFNSLEEKTKTDPLVCAQDIRTCDDGTYVIRNPLNNCEFETCP